MNLKRVAVIGVICLTGALALAQVASVRLEARLTGQGKGKAKWQMTQRGRQIQSELEVEGEGLTPNTGYGITIGGQPMGLVMTNSFGSFNIDQRFIGPNHPNIESGMEVTVANANGVALTGTFVNK